MLFNSINFAIFLPVVFIILTKVRESYNDEDLTFLAMMLLT